MRLLVFVAALCVVAMLLGFWLSDQNGPGSGEALSSTVTSPSGHDARTTAPRLVERPTPGIEDGRREESGPDESVPDPGPSQTEGEPEDGTGSLETYAELNARYKDLMNAAMEEQMAYGEYEYIPFSDSEMEVSFDSPEKGPDVLFTAKSVPQDGVYKFELTRSTFPDLFEVKDQMMLAHEREKGSGGER